MRRNIFFYLINFAAIIGFFSGKPEAGALFLVLGQLTEINDKLGDKNGTTN